MSLDSLPPYVYCTRCKTTVDCPSCGRKGAADSCTCGEADRLTKAAKELRPAPKEGDTVDVMAALRYLLSIKG